MAEYQGQEKTEQPTSKKLEDSRQKGMVAKSTEINSLLIVFAGIITIFLFQSTIARNFASFSTNIFGYLDTFPSKIGMIQNFFTDWYWFFIAVTSPVIIAIFLISIAANVSQVGFRITPKALEPKFDKLNPISGLKRIVSSRALFEVLKTLVKFFLISIFTYYVLKDFISIAPVLESSDITDIVAFMIDSAFSLIWKFGLLYTLLAGADFAYQRYKFRKDMMMTKEEVKEEMKQTEGDPVIKSRIKKMQLQAARNRMMKELPTADVVITNPTHYAVALRYDMFRNKAPEVIAKGVDELALRIKKVAAEHNIPIHEDRELARALYKMCDIGDVIPQQLFRAVAQVLAYIYNLRKNKKKSY
jgi:flagellar biosynthetic protein FlhB